MKKYSIEVQFHYSSFDYAEVEIEADSMEEAKRMALELGREDMSVCWLEGQVYDSGYEINDEECKEIDS